MKKTEQLEQLEKENQLLHHSVMASNKRLELEAQASNQVGFIHGDKEICIMILEQQRSNLVKSR